MALVEPDRVYTRRQVRRLLGLAENRLRAWERARLVPVQQDYKLADLLALRTLQKLSGSRLSAARIRAVLEAVRRKVRDLEEPLQQLRILRDGRRIVVLVEGQKMEPLSGQLLLDFDRQELARLVSFPAAAKPTPAARAREAEAWFEKGVELERRGAPLEVVVEAYERAVALDPRSAGAMVNIGTLYFHHRRWADAERWYRRALEVEPGYALAHFNLANLYDELDNRAAAVEHYLEAIRLDPYYADAHYNLALLYQLEGETLAAVRHWQIYLRLDSTSPWATIARRELEKLRRSAILPGGQEALGGDSGPSGGRRDLPRDGQ